MTPRQITLKNIFESAEVIDLDEAARFIEDQSGPFMKGIRVCCPLKRFQRRKTMACAGCEFYHGVAKKVVIGGVDPNDPETVARQYTIVCGHPSARGLAYFPED